MELRRFIYLSTLSGQVAENGLRQIMQRSREHNSARHLTGALLFDGESFAQLIEGCRRDVDPVIDAIRADPRHVGFTPVYDVTSAGERRCLNWQNGYVESDAFEDFRAICTRLPTDLDDVPTLVVDAFMWLLTKADVI